MKKNKWGVLRETREDAEKVGTDEDTGMHRTGLEDYLAAIFPEIPSSEWIHNKGITGLGRKIRPDYRCERLKLIVEFDGLPHYRDPERIKVDYENTRLYEGHGYKVIRIPYFIQLSNDVVRQMFDREIEEQLLIN